MTTYMISLTLHGRGSLVFQIRHCSGALVAVGGVPPPIAKSGTVHELSKSRCPSPKQENPRCLKGLVPLTAREYNRPPGNGTLPG